MPRKSIEDYHRQGVKTPVLAWILDHPIVYFPVAALCLLVITALIAAGFRDLSAMAAEPEDNSPYENTEARDFLGKQFAADIVQQHPDSIDSDEWTANNEARPNEPLFSAEECQELEAIPNSMLTMYRGSGEGLRVDAFIFGAGQAKRYFEDAGSIIENCDSANDYEVDTFTVNYDDEEYELDYYSFEHGENEYTVISAGDAILQLRTDDTNVSSEEALEFYANYAVESLNRTQWKCENITYSYDDYTRSFYHDFQNYKGLNETEELEAETRTDSIPEPVLTRNGNDEAEDAIQIVDNPNLEEPEAPLPSDFEEIPESTPQRPELPLEFEVRSDFTDTAYYEIPDYTGPGCGWEWSAQVSPVYDEQALDHNRGVVRTEVQNNLERDAANYNESAFYYALRVLNQEPIITRWNEYVNTVNSIHADWIWLEEQRDALWPQWRQYLNDHEAWRNFPQEQAAAQEEYDQEWEQYEDDYARYEDNYADYEDALEECYAQRDAVDEWNQQWGEAIRNGEAVPNGEDPYIEEWDEDEEEYVEVEVPEAPERPQNCSSLPSEPSAPAEPSRPAILDQSRGTEPQPPSPSDSRVTIPESWDNPARD